MVDAARQQVDGGRRRGVTALARAVAARVQQPPWLVRRGPSHPPRIALTFDDGPDDLTDAYLACLDRLGVPATFFLCGDRVEVEREVIPAYLRSGHQVASHGWDHTAFPRLSSTELRWQLRRTEVVLGRQATGRPWVRPPYGALSARVLAQLAWAGYTVAMWSVDSLDHAGPTPERLVERCSPGRLVAGDVVLLHEGEPATLAALPTIVGRLRDAGFELVTMADLLAR